MTPLRLQVQMKRLLERARLLRVEAAIPPRIRTARAASQEAILVNRVDNVLRDKSYIVPMLVVSAGASEYRI